MAIIFHQLCEVCIWFSQICSNPSYISESVQWVSWYCLTKILYNIKTKCLKLCILAFKCYYMQLEYRAIYLKCKYFMFYYLQTFSSVVSVGNSYFTCIYVLLQRTVLRKHWGIYFFVFLTPSCIWARTIKSFNIFNCYSEIITWLCHIVWIHHESPQLKGAQGKRKLLLGNILSNEL